MRIPRFLSSVWLLLASVEALVHQAQPLVGGYLSSLSGKVVPTTLPPPSASDGCYDYYHLSNSEPLVTEAEVPHYLGNSGPLTTEALTEQQIMPSVEIISETVSNNDVVFAHAPKSYFAIPQLTHKGPRKGADVGEPQEAIRSLDCSNICNNISIGSWWCTAGGWLDQTPRIKTEVFLVLSGRGCLTDLDGTQHFWGPGDTVVIPHHWAGRWDVLQAIHKVGFTIVDDNPPDAPAISSCNGISMLNDIREYQGDNSGFERNKPNLFLFGDTETGYLNGSPSGGTMPGTVGVDPNDQFVRAVVVPYQEMASLHKFTEGAPDAQQTTTVACPSTASQTIYRAGSTTVGGTMVDVGSYSVEEQRRSAECFHVLEGVFVLTNNDGSAHRCVEGDTIVIPKGWTGQWDVLVATRALKVVVA